MSSLGKALSMSSSSLEECRWWVLTWESTNQSGTRESWESSRVSVPPKPKLLLRQELPRGIPGTSPAPWISSAEGLLWNIYGNAFYSTLEVFFSKTRTMRKTRNIPFFCPGKPRSHRRDQLTKSTVFLRFVSVSVSSTKLSHLPLQSSGSSGTRGSHNPWIWVL